MHMLNALNNISIYYPPKLQSYDRKSSNFAIYPIIGCDFSDFASMNKLKEGATN